MSANANSGDELTPFETAFEHLMTTAPERWAELDRDQLTAVEADALVQLNRIGLIEIRSPMTMRMAGHPVSFSYTLTFHGEAPPPEDLERAANIDLAEWYEAYKAWCDSEKRSSSPFQSQVADIEQWRLTQHGATVRDSMGKTRLARNIKLAVMLILHPARPLVCGRVEVSKIVRHGPPPQPADVNVANWQAGGEVMGKVIGEVIAKAMADATKSKPESTTDDDHHPVTLDQIAALLNVSKSQLEKKMRAIGSTMPLPDIEGGGGKPHYWKWSTIRPWLVLKYPGRDIKLRFPRRTDQG